MTKTKSPIDRENWLPTERAAIDALERIAYALEGIEQALREKNDCPRCDGAGWVCEQHKGPWFGGSNDCGVEGGCAGPGELCPRCRPLEPTPAEGLAQETLEEEA